MLLTKHEGEAFHNQTVYISGQAFIRCKFIACTLILRETLYHLDVIPGRIFRREDTEQGASGAGKVLDFAAEIATESIDPNPHALTGSHPFELRLLEVRRNPDIVKGHDHHQPLPWLEALTKLNRLPSNHAA